MKIFFSVLLSICLFIFSCKSSSPTSPSSPYIKEITPTPFIQIGSFATPGAGVSQFNIPHSIAVDNLNGYFYVTDSNNNRVCRFNLDGTNEFTWGSLGTTNNYFTTPLGIAVDNTGLVYVADWTQRIQIFNPNGSFVTVMGQAKTSPYAIPYYDLLVDASKNVFSLDSNTIYKVDANGNTTLAFGGFGYTAGKMTFAYSMAFNATQNLIYVTDHDRQLVNIYDTSGIFQKSFTVSNLELQDYFYPTGVALDSDDYIYVVTDWYVYLFDPNGKPLFKWDWGIPQSGNWYGPRDIAVDAQKYIYVPITYFDTVKIWKNVR